MMQHIYQETSGTRLTQLQPGKKGRVVLFGEVLADVFPGQTVLGGAPFNVARHLRAFGQNPVLITRLGNDTLRDEVLDEMAHYGMETLGIQCCNKYPTGRVQVHVRNGQHRFEILPAQAYDFIHPAVVRMATLSVNPSLVYFGTLAQRNETSRRALKSLLRSTAAAKFLDINLRAPWYDEKTLRLSLQFADTVKLNAEELAILADMFELPQTDATGRVKELIHRFDLARVLVTCGEEGAWLVKRDGKRIQAVAKERIVSPVDTVGAGDGFAAVCILGTLRRWSMAMTLERANSFAAAICGIRGAVPADADFYRPFGREWGI